MTYDDDRSWRPRPAQESGGWRSGAGETTPGLTGDDAEAAPPDPHALTTQIDLSPVGPGPVLDDPNDPDDLAAGLGSEEAFEPAEATSAVDDGPDLAVEDEVEPPPASSGRRGRKAKVIGADPGLAIFVDSSAIVALVDRDDGAHAAAVAAYGNLLAQGYKLFTTNYVMAEAFDLLSTGVGPDVARRFLRDCKLAIYHADEQDERRAKRVVLRQTGPNGLTLTDAVTFVVMERLGVADAFAVDPGFLANAT